MKYCALHLQPSTYVHRQQTWYSPSDDKTRH